VPLFSPKTPVSNYDKLREIVEKQTKSSDAHHSRNEAEQIIRLKLHKQQENEKLQKEQLEETTPRESKNIG